MTTLTITLANHVDHRAIVEFNRAMALETESKVLIESVISAGVASLLDHPQRGFYLVAQQDNTTVGSLLVTYEWSDWRCGLFWWIQSVYVLPQHRGQGVYRTLYNDVRRRAAEDPAVCGFRLYVENDNTRAQQIYQSLGMTQTHYQMYEELKPKIIFCESSS